MMYAEETVYHSCLSFCRDFFIYTCKVNELERHRNTEFYQSEALEKEVEHTKRALVNSFERLKANVDKIAGDIIE